MGVQLLGPDKQWPVSSVISLLSAVVRPLSSSPALLCPECPHSPQLPGVRVPVCGTTGQWWQVCGDSSNLLCTPPATARLQLCTVCIHTTSSASSHYLPPRTPSLRWLTTSQVQDTAPKYVLKLTMFYTIYTLHILFFTLLHNRQCTLYTT